MKTSALKNILLVAPIFLVVIFYVLLVNKVDQDDEMPQFSDKNRNGLFTLGRHISHLNESNIEQSFPYKIYVDSADTKNISAIKEDLILMDSFCKNSVLNRKVMWIALTDSMEEKFCKEIPVYNPDALIMQLSWAVKFNHYSDIDKENSQLFKAIYDHWLNFISQKLRDQYREDYFVKYSFKHKYLVSRCEENNYNPNIGTDNKYEKAMDHIINNNWSYLINRIWIATTWIFKSVLFLLMLVTVYSYYYTFRKIYIHLKRKL